MWYLNIEIKEIEIMLFLEKFLVYEFLFCLNLKYIKVRIKKFMKI